MSLRRLFEIRYAYELANPPRLVVASGPETVVAGLPPGSKVVLRRTGAGTAQRTVDRLELGSEGATLLVLREPWEGLPVSVGWEVWTAVENASARVATLRDQVALALSISLEGDRRIASGWWMLVHVLPSFALDAVFGLAYDGSSCRGLLAVRSVPLPQPVEIEPRGLHLLRHLESVAIALEEPPTGAIADGIGYRIELATASLDARFAFANPLRPDLRALERSLHQADELLAGGDHEYVKTWKGYLRETP